MGILLYLQLDRCRVRIVAACTLVALLGTIRHRKMTGPMESNVGSKNTLQTNGTLEWSKWAV
jgi:hypothetical protein